jgi:hypothetical protein
LEYDHYLQLLEKSRKYVAGAIEDMENQIARFNRCFSTAPEQIKANWARLSEIQQERKEQLDQRIGCIEDAVKRRCEGPEECLASFLCRSKGVSVIPKYASVLLLPISASVVFLIIRHRATLRFIL